MHPEITQSPIICETSRFILRKFDARDTESLLGLRGDPVVMQFCVAGPESREDVRDEYLPNCLLRYSRDGFGQWAVVQKSDHALVGECGICVQEIDGKREFEVSYWLRRDTLSLFEKAVAPCAVRVASDAHPATVLMHCYSALTVYCSNRPSGVTRVTIASFFCANEIS